MRAWLFGGDVVRHEQATTRVSGQRLQEPRRYHARYPTCSSAGAPVARAHHTGLGHRRGLCCAAPFSVDWRQLRTLRRLDTLKGRGTRGTRPQIGRKTNTGAGFAVPRPLGGQALRSGDRLQANESGCPSAQRQHWRGFPGNWQAPPRAAALSPEFSGDSDSGAYRRERTALLRRGIRPPLRLFPGAGPLLRRLVGLQVLGGIVRRLGWRQVTEVRPPESAGTTSPLVRSHRARIIEFS